MRCLKCGRESEETFCRICQEEMEKYPVKPGTIVLLPKERTEEKKPAPRKPQVPPEAVIRGQRRTIRRLSGGIAALVALVVLLGAMTLHLLGDQKKTPLGKNYSTVTRPSEEESTAPATQDDEAIAPAELEDYLYAQSQTKPESRQTK